MSNSPQPRPLVIDEPIRDAISTAFESANFITVAYNGEDGWPHVSRRGSTQVVGDRQLAIWVRKTSDGLVAALATRPEVTLFYIDMTQRGVVYTFYGHGSVTDDPAIADAVWNATPERERAQDPQRAGTAVIIDITKIVAQGRQPEQNFTMVASES